MSEIARRMALTLGAAALLVSSAAAFAQSYPSRPISLVAPYPPGGGADIIARFLAAKLAAQMGSPVIVENRPGANGNIGTAHVAKASPDGHTLLLATTGSHVLNQFLYKHTGFDPIGDFSPVALVGSSDLILVVSRNSPFRSAQELVDFARANPSKLNFASAGSGSTPHLTLAMLETAANVKFTHVPYKGANAALTDLVGGQVDAYFAVLPSAVGMIKASKVNVFATTGARRTTLLENVPTMQELGFPDVDSDLWFGIVAPSKTPAATTEKLESAFRSFLSASDSRKQLADLGVEARFQGAAEFASLLVRDSSRWKAIVRSSGATLD